MAMKNTAAVPAMIPLRKLAWPDVQILDCDVGEPAQQGAGELVRIGEAGTQPGDAKPYHARPVTVAPLAGNGAPGAPECFGGLRRMLRCRHGLTGRERHQRRQAEADRVKLSLGRIGDLI